jgi:hypothetical protein
VDQWPPIFQCKSARENGQHNYFESRRAPQQQTDGRVLNFPIKFNSLNAGNSLRLYYMYGGGAKAASQRAQMLKFAAARNVSV